jgi:hypothetical protein
MRMVPASQLKPAPNNWHIHGDAQRQVLRGTLEQIGFAGAELVWVDDAGELVLIDGHLRREEVGDAAVPVLVTDLSEDEAKLLLATHDTIGHMAQINVESYRAVVEGLEIMSPAAQALVEEVAAGGSPADIPDDAMRSRREGHDSAPQDLGELSYRLMIQCRDEAHQAELLAELEGRGLDVKVLVV